MKKTSYAVVLGGVAAITWCLWRGAKEPAAAAPAPKDSAALRTAIETVKAPLTTRTLAGTGLKNRLWGRLEADLTIVLAEADPVRRDEKIELFVDSIAFDDIPTALQFFQQQEQTQLLQDLQALLIRKGASTDPRSAAAWAGQLSQGMTRSAAIAGVAVVWANQNAPDAARWALALAVGEDRENGLSHVAFEAARTQPLLALELASNLAPNDAREELVRHAARQWAAQDPAAAAAWAGELTNPTFREETLAEIAAAWGETDPSAAATLALESLSGGKPQEDALISIAQHWVQKEPERAATWVLDFPQALQASALENVVQLWANQDAGEAKKWAESLPPGARREMALNALAVK